MNFRTPLLVAAISSLALASTDNASIIPIGSSFTLLATDAPDNYTAATTFGTTTLVDGGAAKLTMSQVPTGANSEWDIWTLTTVSGGPIGGNVNAYWDISMDYVLSQNINFDAVLDQWTVNGVGVVPTGNIGGIGGATANNPVTGGGGYYNSGFSVPYTAQNFSNWDQIYVTPYSYVQAGGIDPTTANGFTWALHFTAVPEPASMLAAVAFISLSTRRKIRR